MYQHTESTDTVDRDPSSSSAGSTATDSALSSGGEPSSRRDSATVFGTSGDFRPRRSTINSKFPVKSSPMKVVPPTPEDLCWRKVSCDSQFEDYNLSGESESEEDEFESLKTRRMSVDERTLRSADYAILRKNMDRSFEIVGAFNRHHNSAYRNYLQSMTSYDIAPNHCVVFTISADLTIRKTIHAMCAQAYSHRCCMVVFPDGTYSIFTISDFLYCLQKRKTNPALADYTVARFLEEVQPGKRLITASTETSVWNLGRQFRLNHVHRIPIMEVNGMLRSNQLFCLLSLRPVFAEIARLVVQTQSAISPDLTKLTLSTCRLGKRSGLATIKESTVTSTAIDILLDRKISVLPVVDENGVVAAVFCKYDVLAAVARTGEAGIDKVLEKPVKELVDPTNMDMVIPPSTTIFAAIQLLVSSMHQCLLIVEDGKLVGVVSYADIFDYILNYRGGTVYEKIEATFH